MKSKNQGHRNIGTIAHASHNKTSLAAALALTLYDRRDQEEPSIILQTVPREQERDHAEEKE